MINKMIHWLNYLLVLVKKEFLIIFSDPANRAILFVPALLQALLYGYAGTYYVLDDLFKDVDRIIFSKAFMEENCLELKVNNQPHRNMIYTHYIDYKGIRFMLNTYHLNGDLSLETDHLIIFLRDTVKHQRPYQLLLSTTKTEE